MVGVSVSIIYLCVCVRLITKISTKSKNDEMPIMNVQCCGNIYYDEHCNISQIQCNLYNYIVYVKICSKRERGASIGKLAARIFYLKSVCNTCNT